MNTDAIVAAPEARTSKGWTVSLWIAQVLLAFGFGMGGFMKLAMPMADLVAQMGWPGDLPAALVRFIGMAELAAAFGLILPSATRIRPWLTPLAAAGLAVIVALAMVFHMARGEMEALPKLLMLGAFAVFVTWGRARKAPIEGRRTGRR